MLCSMGGNGTASGTACKRLDERGTEVLGRFRCQGAPLQRDPDLAIGERAIQGDDLRRVAAERGEMTDHRAAVAADHRAGERGLDPESPGVAERLLDQRSVDREAPGL